MLGLLLVGLLALSACHSGTRAIITASRDGAAPRCLDGSTRASPAYERICESWRKAKHRRAAPKDLRPSLAGLAEPPRRHASIRTDERPALSRGKADLLLPTAHTLALLRTTPLSDEARRSLERRMIAQGRLVPTIALPDIIDVTDVLQALRGSVN